MDFVEVRSARGERERIVVQLDEPASSARTELSVLYLHGFGSTQSGEKAELFRRRALEWGWAFCSFDFRGHGASEGTMRELTFSRNLDDVGAVRALLERRGHSRIALFGSSMGGAVGLWHAALAPVGIVAAAHLAPAVGMARGLERWAGPERLDRWRREGTIRFESELVSADLGWELMEDLRRYDLADLVARYRTPTVIFQGQRDESVEWRDVAALAESIERERPGLVELMLFPDGDHRLLDRKEELWEGAAALYARNL